VLLFGRDDVDVEGISKFCSIRANTGVFAGRFYYEVLLKSSGLMQIGWCTL
jgi:Kip1 ubiquitination-promoting complex protein 1